MSAPERRWMDQVRQIRRAESSLAPGGMPEQTDFGAPQASVGSNERESNLTPSYDSASPLNRNEVSGGHESPHQFTAELVSFSDQDEAGVFCVCGKTETDAVHKRE